MIKKYHLYMDESGSFEWQKKKKSSPFVLGVLVPENVHKQLAEAINKTCHKYGYNGFVHATDLRKDKQFGPFIQDQVELLLKYKQVIPFACHYKQDVFSNLSKMVQESLLANRYLNVVQSVLEHLLYLHPGFFGQNMEFDFHPNSRIVVVNKNEESKIQRFKNLGFDGFEIKGNHSKYFKIWNNDILRVSLYRLELEYLPSKQIIGERHWENIETVIAKRSENPLVHWVDNLAWVYGHSYPPLKKAHKKINTVISIKFSYGYEHRCYRDLVHLYLACDLENFLLATLKDLPSFTSAYYRRNLETLVKNTLKNLDTSSFKQLKTINYELDGYLSYSKGNWSFIALLLDFLLEAVEKIPVTVDRDMMLNDSLFHRPLCQ